MSTLLPETLRIILLQRVEQEGIKDPIVFALYRVPLIGWTWFATEGKAVGDDFLFFGYVVGLECEWGYFCLSELESVDINGIKVCRDEDPMPRPLSECLQQYGITEN